MQKPCITIGILAFALTLLFLMFANQPVSAKKDNRLRIAPVSQQAFVPNRVLVKFKSDIGLDHARQIVAALGARDEDELPATQVMVLELPAQADESAFAHALAQRPDVEFAELDRVFRPDDITPNDPAFATWQRNLQLIQAPAAWSTTTGKSTVVIAILDTGVESTHPDLIAKLGSGWNTYNNNSNSSDVTGHGTAVAGTAAAASNNGMGVASVCWSCMIMPVRVSDDSGYGTSSSIASGLNWAADHGARVANISYAISDNATVTSSAKYFQSKGGVVTSSAGNAGTFNSAADNPYILTIGATDYNDVLYGYSNRGNNIDLVAPGDSFTTVRGGAYDSVGGTSFSAPTVAGVAALVLSVNPSLTPTQVQDILKQSADDFGAAGWDTSYGWGRVNAARAVSLASAGTTPTDTTPPSIGFTTPTDSAVVAGVVAFAANANDNVAVSTVAFSMDGSSLVTDTSGPYSFSMDTRALANGTHSVAAVATDAAGNSSQAAISIIVNNVVDLTPPTITITAPTDGTRISTNVQVKVDASDNLGVSKVELYVDGLLQGASMSAPFTIKWNASKAAKGAHTVQCKAYDAAGNAGLSQLITVNK